MGRASADQRRLANAKVTAHQVRETLGFLGFDEVSEGYFIRADGPYGRANDAEDARVFTTVKLGQVVGDIGALSRIVRRFSRVHGPVSR